MRVADERALSGLATGVIWRADSSGLRLRAGFGIMRSSPDEPLRVADENE
jgi:hypothetical protein